MKQRTHAIRGEKSCKLFLEEKLCIIEFPKKKIAD